MRRVIQATAFVFGLVSLSACASHPSHVAAPDVNDPAWSPPGEMSVTVHTAPPPAPTNNATALSCPQPNRGSIPKNQIHAAMY
jgi:hypothetical protein